MKSITEEDLKKIVELANTVPEEYRQKCFELLLTRSLHGTPLSTPLVPPSTPPTPPTSLPLDKPFILPIDVKAFLSQYKIDETVLWRHFHTEGDQIRPIYHIKAHKKARAQIEHALMMALESALTTGKFQVIPDALRQRCEEMKCYDTNYSRNLKKNSKIFKAVGNDELLTLSPDGKSELAELLESLK
jgi:hypothetical protein